MTQMVFAVVLFGQTPSPDPAAKFRSELASKVILLEKENAGAFAGVDGWLFLTAELRFLSVGRFWGDDAIKLSRSPQTELADPVPAILDFCHQLKERGIDLLVVPVPPKAVIYPDKILPELNIRKNDTGFYLRGFYDQLRAGGVEILDLGPLFLENRANKHGEVFCKTDTHWSGMGCVLAASAIAEKVRPKLTQELPRTEYATEWTDTVIDGDLRELLASDLPRPGTEQIRVRSVKQAATGTAVEPDPNSPVLILGDSFTLVFHDFLAERAGLLDQLAVELGFAPDLIGTRGSGATPVRITLYRRSSKDPDYLAKKKVIIWCFASDEFTEAAQGWRKLPVAK
jgi:alginate O-acetyltransferase complex protein AlgJ